MSTSAKSARPQSRKPLARYHHGNLRPALVTEGLAELARTGNAEVSLRELARRVGVSPNAAYRHFTDKEALLAALATEGFKRLGTAGGRARASSSDPSAQLRSYGRAYVAFALHNPALFRLMFGGRVARDATEELARASEDAIAALRSSIAEASRLPIDDPRVEARTVHAWAIVHGLAHLILDRQLDTFAADADHLIDAVLAVPASAR
jgi:AcrR family transcriptional regulator